MNLRDGSGFVSDPGTAAYFDPFVQEWWTTSKILIVLDGLLRFESNAVFSISRMVAHLRAFRLGFGGFTVTVATRDGGRVTRANPDEDQYAYEGFRFDQKVAGKYTIDSFDQIWLFGYWCGNDEKGNDPDSLDPSLDAIANDSDFHPTSTSELKVLSRWMDAGGGLFATGDHHLLGAAMCHRIPRARTMRRWL